MIALYIICAILSVITALVLGYFLFLFICGLFVDPKKEYDTNSKFYRGVLYLSTSIAIWLLRIRIHTSGMEKVPTDTNPLFVSNHLSKYDPILQWQIFRRWEIAFVSKASNFKVPFFGRIIRKCCFLAIDRQNLKSAIVTVNKAATLLEKGEVSVGVYPEGTRNKEPELLPFHNGIFMIAKKAKRPVVVLATRGTNQIYKNAVIRPTDVYVDVVDVISVEEIQKMRSDDIGARVRTAMENALYEKIM